MVIYTAKTNEKLAQITAKLSAPYASDLDKKCFVFCEDKNSLMLERAIANETGGTFNVFVTSFSRYISTRITNINALSKSASSLVVYSIIAKLSGELKRIKLKGSPKLSENVYKLIAQLKSAKVSPDDLKEVIEGENGAFATKLTDIYKIYDAYENYLKDNELYDSNNFFALIPKLVEGDESLKGAKVIFSGFSSVTRQIVDIFEAVEKVCNADFVLLKGNGEFYTNEIVSRVSGIFPSAKICEDNDGYLPEALAIEKGMFSPEFSKKDAVYSDKVNILELKTQLQEVETVAKRIRYEVVKNKKRYKDFAIATLNPGEYQELVLDVFKTYEIPVYVDVKDTMESHPVIRLILSCLEVLRQNYLPKAVLSLCSERLICTQEEYNAIDRYINENAISRKTMKVPFKNIDGDQVEDIRLRVLQLVEPFRSKSTAREYISACREILTLSKAVEKASELGRELVNFGFFERANVNTQAIKKIERVFSEIENIVGDRKMTVSEFKNLFTVATSASEVSVLPLFSDVVYMGDFKSVKQREAKILFAIGLYGDVPEARSDTALLTDRDLIKMEAYKCIIEPKIQIINKRERENVGVSLMSFSEKLYLLYPITLARGGVVTKSEVIEYAKRIFQIEPKNVELFETSGYAGLENDIYGYMTKNQGLRNFALSANDFSERKISSVKSSTAFLEAIKKDEKLYEKAMAIVSVKPKLSIDREVVKNLSASVIEKYFNCPYACFATYNLKLKDDDNGEVRSFEFGNLLHEILEKFVAKIETVKDKEDCYALAVKLFDDALKTDQYARYLNKSEYEHIFNITKEEAKKRCYEVFTEYKQSKFLPIGQEVAFGSLPGARFKGIVLDTPYGQKTLSGKVDRIDKFKDYIRIIDYKTGSPESKAKEEKLYSGTNVQLYLYPLAFLDEKTRLAGAYYYKVNDEYARDDKEAQAFIGKTLYDDEVVLASDTRLESEKESAKYNIKITEKDGERTVKGSTSLLTSAELDSFLTYAKRVCEVGSTELSEGYIAPYPYTGACKYCKFNGMCGFDPELDNTCRELSGITKATIINAVKGDDDE